MNIFEAGFVKRLAAPKNSDARTDVAVPHKVIRLIEWQACMPERQNQ